MTIIVAAMIIIIVIIIFNEFDLLDDSESGGFISDDGVDDVVDSDGDAVVDDGNVDGITEDVPSSIFWCKFESNIPTSQANCFW